MSGSPRRDPVQSDMTGVSTAPARDGACRSSLRPPQGRACRTNGVCGPAGASSAPAPRRIAPRTTPPADRQRSSPALRRHRPTTRATRPPTATPPPGRGPSDTWSLADRRQPPGVGPDLPEEHVDQRDASVSADEHVGGLGSRCASTAARVTHNAHHVVTDHGGLEGWQVAGTRRRPWAGRAGGPRVRRAAFSWPAQSCSAVPPSAEDVVSITGDLVSLCPRTGLEGPRGRCVAPCHSSRRDACGRRVPTRLTNPGVLLTRVPAHHRWPRVSASSRWSFSAPTARRSCRPVPTGVRVGSDRSRRRRSAYRSRCTTPA